MWKVNEEEVKRMRELVTYVTGKIVKTGNYALRDKSAKPNETGFVINIYTSYKMGLDQPELQLMFIQDNSKFKFIIKDRYNEAEDSNDFIVALQLCGFNTGTSARQSKLTIDTDDLGYFVAGLAAPTFAEFKLLVMGVI